MNLADKIISCYFLDRLVLVGFFVSATYSILLWSPYIAGKFIYYRDQIIFFLIPWILLWPSKKLDLLKDKEYRLHILLIVAIIILGIINTKNSDDPTSTFIHMPLFLSSGVMILWASMFLMLDRRHVKIFDWFCCICIAVIACVEITAHIFRDPISMNLFAIFAVNPIPLGSMLILLSPGLARLFASGTSGNRRLLAAAGVLSCLWASLLLLTNKRGTYQGLIAVGLTWLSLKKLRFGLAATIIIIITILLIPLAWLITYKSLDQNIISHYNILYRLECYPFALHIFKKNPVMGTGLRPFTHEKYLSDYQDYFNLTRFQRTLRRIQTFDNMLLTAFVELGSLMSLSYLALIGLIIVKYYRRLPLLAEGRGLDLYRLAALIGFTVSSMTYDSLLFPPVNWLFHMQLGILAASAHTPGLTLPANDYLTPKAVG
jgi:O-antigen ligase